MKKFFKQTLLGIAGFALGASSALAGPAGSWPPAAGDVVLGFQATGGTGSSTNVFYNLGPGSGFRDAPTQPTLVDLNSILTSTYGATWFDRTDLYFGVIANRSPFPESGLGAVAPVDGDSSRTFYVSRAAGDNTAGGAIPFSGLNSSQLGTAGTTLAGQYTMLAGLTASGGVATLNSSDSVRWANSWTQWNPFLNGGQAIAYKQFGGGIQNSFGKSATVNVDLFRVLPTTGSGTYVTTISIDSSGMVNVSPATAVTYFELTPGTITGSGSVPRLAGGVVKYAANSNVTLTPFPSNSSTYFAGWTGAPVGDENDNPLVLTMDGNKTIGATFLPKPVLTINQGSNGTITGATSGAAFNINEVVNLTATPTTGYRFSAWTGASTSTTSPLALTMDADKTISATFVKDNTDTDGDGISNHDELVIHNTNPNVANSLPALPGNWALESTIGSLPGAEISAFDPVSNRLFVTSGSGLSVINLSNPAAPSLVGTVNLSAAPISAVSNDAASVAVSNGRVAVSVLNPNKELAGEVVFLDAATATTAGGFLSKVTVGNHPDCVVFTPNGQRVLVANEGEYLDSNGGPGNTPGSISIINVSGGFAAPSVTNLDFSGFDAATLRAQNPPVRIFAGQTAANDLEPEYIAVAPDGNSAMVSLQENNAVAIVSLTGTPAITSVVGLGTKSFSSLLADFSDRDSSSGGQISLLTTGWPVSGLYMPDAVASVTLGGTPYYVMANEGDDRNDFIDPNEMAAVKDLDLDDTTFPTESVLKQDANLGRLSVTTIGADGLALATPYTQLLAIGGRSFSIRNASGALVYDSGDLIDRTVASYGRNDGPVAGANTVSNPINDDSRSDNKSSEPEGIAVATINGQVLAFVALERANGVMVLNITNVIGDPNSVSVVAFLRGIDDVSPEGVFVVPATDSPNNKALVVISNEVSNTVSVFSFAVPTQTVTLSSVTNGVINGLASGGVYPQGDTATLSAVAATGYAFQTWTGDVPAGQLSQNPLNLVVDADKTVGATFGPDTSDGNGNGFTAFEELQLSQLISGTFYVGQTVNLNIGQIMGGWPLSGGRSLTVAGLPRGLVFNTTGVNAGRITGTILAESGDTVGTMTLRQGTTVRTPLQFDLTVVPFQLLGRYEALIENGSLPVGKALLTVTGAKSFSATLELQGQAVRRLSGAPAGGAEVTSPFSVTFPAGRGGIPAEATVTFVVSPSSDLVTGTQVTTGVAGTNNLRGFRLARPGRAPVQRVTVALENAVASTDRTVTPGGTGFATGSLSSAGLLTLATTLGDGTGTTLALNLSETNQAVVFAQPYRDKTASFVGGILTVGNLGQPSRGASAATPLTPGLQWRKFVPVIAQAAEKSYPSGFGNSPNPLAVNGRVSRYIPMTSAEGLALSLGLNLRELNVSYVVPPALAGAQQNMAYPSKLALRNTFALVRLAPTNAIPWTGRATPSVGSFGGSLTFTSPAPRVSPTGSVSGVFLQDGTSPSDTKVGVGLIRIPTTVTGGFVTSGIEFNN